MALRESLVPEMSKQKVGHRQKFSPSAFSGTILASFRTMNARFLPVLTLSGAALLFILATPRPAPAQAGAPLSDADTVALAAVVDDVVAQQDKLQTNANAMDEKIAKIAEEVRQGRIFAARGGRGGSGGGTAVGGGSPGAGVGGGSGQ